MCWRNAKTIGGGDVILATIDIGNAGKRRGFAASKMDSHRSTAMARFVCLTGMRREPAKRRSRCDPLFLIIAVKAAAFR
jgi:hypothetical protein